MKGELLSMIWPSLLQSKKYGKNLQAAKYWLLYNSERYRFTKTVRAFSDDDQRKMDETRTC